MELNSAKMKSLSIFTQRGQAGGEVLEDPQARRLSGAQPSVLACCPPLKPDSHPPTDTGRRRPIILYGSTPNALRKIYLGCKTGKRVEKDLTSQTVREKIYSCVFQNKCCNKRVIWSGRNKSKVQ